MSTRSSKVFVPPFHIYLEQDSGDICFEFCWEHVATEKRKVNDKYESPVIGRDCLLDLYRELGEFLFPVSEKRDGLNDEESEECYEDAMKGEEWGDD
jgi:hypothetical protein